MTNLFSWLEYGVRNKAVLSSRTAWAIVLTLACVSAVWGFWDAASLRPSVEPPRVEYLLDSMMTLGDPGRGLTRFVEDSTNTPEERSHAATLLAAYYNRNEEPARALLALFYVRRETGKEWSAEQALVAAEAYDRLGNREWTEASLDLIHPQSYLVEVAHTLRIYGMLEDMRDTDSLVEIRSRFERQLERSSDPSALLLAVHGLGLCYLAKGTLSACDTASVFLGFAMSDTASAYLSFALEEYRKYGQNLPLIERLTTYGIWWSGTADLARGDGWGALDAAEEIYLGYPDSRFWDASAVRYGVLQLQRGRSDSARLAATELIKNTREERFIQQGRLILASADARVGAYDSAAVAFASLSRSLAVGDTLRVLAHAGMAASLVKFIYTIPEADSIIPALQRLDLSGYNALALPRVNCEIGTRLLEERQLCQADTFFRRSLRYYPDPLTETRSRLNLGIIALAQGDWSGSIENYERALTLISFYEMNVSGLADMRFNVGLAYLERSRCSNGNGPDDLRRARTFLRQASELDPGGETGELARKRLRELE